MIKRYICICDGDVHHDGEYWSESSGAGQKPVLIDQPVVPEMIRCIKCDNPPERVRPASVMGTWARNTSTPSFTTHCNTCLVCRFRPSSDTWVRTRNASTRFITSSRRSVFLQQTTSIMAAS